jgi:hypothetical protein
LPGCVSMVERRRCHCAESPWVMVSLQVPNELER